MPIKSTSFFSPRLHIRGIFITAGVTACLATILGFFGRFSWFLDLFSHFRVQYLLGLLVLGIFMLISRRPKTAIAFFGFSFLNLMLVLPLYFGGQDSSGHTEPRFRAMLINVNTRLGDPERVSDIISSADPDILVLEEISDRWMLDLAWLTNSHPHNISQPRDDNFGIGVFSKFPLEDAEALMIGSADVPSIVATVNLGDKYLRLIATHPPPPAGKQYSRWRNDQLSQLPDYTKSSGPVLLLGDLNTTSWSYHFRRLLDRTGLLDSARGYGIQPSWPSHNILLRIPLDHCLHSADIVILDRQIGKNVASDHYPLIVDFVIQERQ